MKSKIEIKQELLEAVEQKKIWTQKRLSLKAIPYSDRTSAQHYEMLGAGREASVQKEVVRHLQLAYAFARGQRYWVAERFARESPYLRRIADIAGASEEEVRTWYEAPVSDEERAAFDAHLASARVRAHEARKARRSAA